MGDERNKYLKVYMEQCTKSLENLILQNRNFVPCGKLQDWNTNESKKSKEIYTTIMSGVLAGLAHLHDEGFVKDEVAKLADAGLLQLHGHTCTASGSYFPTTVAPEVFTDEYCDDAESDIYSIGILMWELYYCRPAFTFARNEDLASKSVQKEEYKFEVEDARELIDHVQRGYRPTFETYRPVPELMELITKCWSADMSQRPTAKMVVSELKKLIKSEDQNKVYVC
ncbi:unnamed protein product [Mytilus coruscus]|uniref:Protein kinase domain-containing protein n=1 Tax=Mytilus coruscus TaxID=42192 RepID=A0A6J8AWE7_MYTCO|nr:unnamed protein product [Mytilus coruscus]